MCKDYNIAKKIVRKKIENSRVFTYDDIVKDIHEAKGVLRVAPKYTLSEYLNYFEDINVIEYISKDNKYRVLN